MTHVNTTQEHMYCISIACELKSFSRTVRSARVFEYGTLLLTFGTTRPLITVPYAKLATKCLHLLLRGESILQGCLVALPSI